MSQAYWLYAFFGEVVLFFALKELKLLRSKFSYFIDRFMLKVPIVGDILYQSIMARFASTLSTTFAAGVPLIDELNSVAGAAGNRLY
ncbi:type II secretion system F family protein, partial [Gilvimarinus sp. 1_MG-2023]|nr:type II secretion system F family protein [Gilvimarinus sp. 1_MG-2023]